MTSLRFHLNVAGVDHTMTNGAITKTASEFGTQ